MPKKTAEIIDGKKIADHILSELHGRVTQLKRPPGLAVLYIGDDPASALYIKNKKKACYRVNIEFHEYRCGGRYYPSVTEKEILEMIDWLNGDSDIDGIIVQLPIPKKFDTEKIIKRIDPAKDVDGFHPESKRQNVPPLIAAIEIALAATQKNLMEKTIVVVAKNPIFSNPLIEELKRQGKNVAVVSPTDSALDVKCKTADVLIVVAGKKGLIKKSMVKFGAIVIDAGTNLADENRWVGDVDAKVNEVAGFLTPVPGGIGPLTVAMLLKNTYDRAAKNQKG